MRTPTITTRAVIGLTAMFTAVCLAEDVPAPSSASHPQLMGNRFFTFSTVVRIRQIETSREEAHGPDESTIQTPREARVFREAIAEAWPGARITWAFSWLALNDPRPDYVELRELVAFYHQQHGDEITFIPGAYFANMYNTREQVNRDLHDGLNLVSGMVGGGYRPKSVIAGFLSAENQRYLAEKEGIHVCQGNIWSQYAVDNGDGEGSISYPYYPSREHFCKPAQGKEDFIDCVNLDGWTVDFLCARIPGRRTVNGVLHRSRQGVGPIETVIGLGTELGTQSMLATTATHFDDGFKRNGFGWINCIWELGLVEARKIYGYQGRNGMEGLRIWFTETRKRWPNAKFITQGEFGLLWRDHFKNNDKIDYRFSQRGSGVAGSDPSLEVRWYMNKDFRLATLRNWKEGTPEKIIDFTRYDLPAKEPADPEPGNHSRNWSLMNRLNQKGTRPQDQPVAPGELTAEEQAFIKRRHPEIFEAGKDSPGDKPVITDARAFSHVTQQLPTMNLARLLWILATLSCASAFAAGKDVKLFLLAGQSNMDGCGSWNEMPADFQQPPANVRIWDNRDSKWVPLGQDTTATARKMQFGPEVAFAHRISKAYPGYEIALIKTSAGGTKLHGSWSPGQSMYERLIRNYRNAVEDLKKSGKNFEIAGMLWMQGESDSETLEMANAYEASLKVMFSDVRQKTGREHLPIVMGRISSSLLKKTPWKFDHAAVVQKAQDAVAAADPDTSIIHTDQLTTLKDNTHFDTKGQLTLGDEMATLMLKALAK